MGTRVRKREREREREPERTINESREVRVTGKREKNRRRVSMRVETKRFQSMFGASLMKLKTFTGTGTYLAGS